MVGNLYLLCIRSCIKRLLAAMAGLYGDAELARAEPKTVDVAMQNDTFSCGWRTMINAECILQNLFCEQPLITKVKFYQTPLIALLLKYRIHIHAWLLCLQTAVRRVTEAYVDRYRATTIQDIINVSSEKDDQARFADDDDIEILLATEDDNVQKDKVKVQEGTNEDDEQKENEQEEKNHNEENEQKEKNEQEEENVQKDNAKNEDNTQDEENKPINVSL